MRSVIAISLALLLTGCGFHLRGPSNIPFATMYVKGPQYSPFTVQLKRAITAGSHTTLTADPKTAKAILDITGEQRWVEILTLTSGGRVGEYRLHYTVTFRLYDNKNHQFLPPTSIALHRELTFNDAVVLAKTAEENMLYKDMQTDAVQQLVRRLEAVKVKS
jgi:LPS-assembly lipoprotein